MLDAICTNTFAPSHITASSAFPESAAAAVEDLKRKIYALLASGYHFVPISMETSGAIGPSAIAFIKEVGRRIADWEANSRVTSFLFLRISIAIVR